jgi:hypothetical protein
MLYYPSIENHHNERNLNTWLSEHPKIKTVPCVAQQKYDGSNLGIQFAEDNSVDFFTRNSKLAENENFNGLREILKRQNYSFMMNTIKKWKLENSEIKSINLFGEIYGPGVQRRIDYGTEKQIKFFDVYFNGQIQTPSFLKTWFEQLGLLDFLVEYLKIGILEELLCSLNECKTMVKNEIEGVVIKPLEEVFFNSEGSSFCLKLKVEGFDDTIKPAVKKEKVVNKPLRNIADYITENRIQDVRGKQPWKSKEDLIYRVLEDAFNDFKKSLGEVYPVEDLTPKEKNGLSKKILNLCQKLYNLDTGELL